MILLIVCIFLWSFCGSLSQKESFSLPMDYCVVSWFKADIDHYEPNQGHTFNLRYFICDHFWDKTGPVFFYAGNEADVTLYLNNTGLMWENAPRFRALLVFAEHRYFGQSLPFGAATIDHMEYLSVEQALADYASLILFLSNELFTPETPVIAFGGSYGGMLASWLRMKYPFLVDGAIAASAPILSFLGDNPPYDDSGFYKIVTDDASPACQRGIRKSWDLITTYSETPSGMQKLKEIFRLCPNSIPQDIVGSLFGWIESAASYLAMGDYPYPTAYITNGGCVLPSWPMDVACSFFDTIPDNPDPDLILSATRDFSGVFYNCTGKLTCFDLNQSVNNETLRDGEFWDYLYCAEVTQPFSQNGITDMFYPSPFNLSDVSDQCYQTWGIRPRPFWMVNQFGGAKALETASNIVFSNGEFDPWRSGGVLKNYGTSVVSIVIKQGAHHLDLFFSNPLDPQAVKDARAVELDWIKLWIKEKQQKQKKKLTIS